MKDVYPIPEFILDAYNSCTINWEAKQIKFPRRQFADALAKSGYTKEAEDWFNQVAEETGLKINANEIFQICIRHHLTEYKPAKCPTCGKLLSLYSVKVGVQYCSNRCAQSDPTIKAKVQGTIKKRYGEKGLGSEAILAKTRATVQAKYGVDSVLQAKEVREKIKQTTLKRYGVENVYAAKEIKEKIRKTNLERYGTESAIQSDVIKEKLKKTNQKRYGGNAPICSQKVKYKIKNTVIENYGVEHPMMSQEVKDKIKKTNLERYGVDVPIKSKEIQDRAKKTNLERYGTEYAMQSKIVRNKAKKTLLAKYNVDVPAKSEEIKAKIRKTNQERYGVDYVLQAPKVIAQSNHTRRIKYFPVLTQLVNNKRIKILSSQEKYIDNFYLRFKCMDCGYEWDRNLKQNPLVNSVRSVYCPKCTKYASKAEKDLLFYIKSLYSGTILANDRKLIKPYELDIYLPEKKLAFEFNGTYWHSDICKPAKYHITKTRLCNKKKVRLIHIFEHEWTFNQEKIKSLIKSALGIFDVRLYARQCELKEISHPEYKKFLELYHLQNSVNSSIRYGLYYKDELVSVIGFGKSRFKKGEVELHRYCVKAGYQIVGGFSKLIKHACKDANISEFISYIDLAHFSGRGYKKVGFKLVEVTSPSYIYIRGDEIKSRMQCQKHKLEAFLENFDPAKSEYENMLLNDWDRVYDCGNLKVKYTL